jgi:hypothetical protein
MQQPRSNSERGPDELPRAAQPDATAGDVLGVSGHGSGAEGPRSSPQPPHPATLDTRGLRAALETVGKAVAPTTLLTALLFYFGWAYTDARALYFGIDSSVLGYSIQDYMLRSVDAVFIPLGALLIAGVFLLAVHSKLNAWIRGGDHARLLALLRLTLFFVGVILLVAGVAGVVRHPVFGQQLFLPPLFCSLGTISTAYSVYLRSRLPRFKERDGMSRNDGVGQPPALRSVYLTVAYGLVILSIFWLMGDWARIAGWGRARWLDTNLGARPGVIVYAKAALDIEPRSGVEVAPLQGAGTYRFRYNGLKLLIRSNKMYFLVPSEWTYADGVVILLPDSDATRIEFSPR